jgi:hypothetical protein
MVERLLFYYKLYFMKYLLGRKDKSNSMEGMLVGGFLGSQKTFLETCWIFQWQSRKKKKIPFTEGLVNRGTLQSKVATQSRHPYSHGKENKYSIC